MARARNELRQVAKLGYWRESDARVLIGLAPQATRNSQPESDLVDKLEVGPNR
jgi:hypothetical protein